MKHVARYNKRLIYKVCIVVLGRIISTVVVGAVFGSKWIILSRPCQRTSYSSSYRSLVAGNKNWQ